MQPTDADKPNLLYKSPAFGDYNPGIKALLFDVFGTVVDWRRSITADLQQLFASSGIERDWEAFALDWRALYDPSMARIREGTRPFVTLDRLHRENLDTLLPAYDLGTLTESERDHINRTWHRLNPWDDIVPAQAKLKPAFILATLSNGNIELMVNLARHGGLTWDAILGAELTQAYKPHPDAYLGSMNALGLHPTECVMVAAHNADLAQAKQLGMLTAFVARPDEYGTRQTVDFVAEDAWDFIAEDMTALADQLLSAQRQATAHQCP